jgi:hypothetical protein
LQVFEGDWREYEGSDALDELRRLGIINKTKNSNGFNSRGTLNCAAWPVLLLLGKTGLVIAGLYLLGWGIYKAVKANQARKQNQPRAPNGCLSSGISLKHNNKGFTLPQFLVVMGAVIMATFAAFGWYRDTHTSFAKAIALDLSKIEINVEDNFSDFKGLVISNGGYYYGEHRLSGWMVVNGKEIGKFNRVGTTAAGAVFVKTNDNRYFILPVVRVERDGKKVNDLERTLAQAGININQVEDAIQAGPMAVYNGEITSAAQKWVKRGAKQIIGIDKKGRLVVISSTRFLLGAVGPRGAKMAEAAKRMGIQYGMFVDRGIRGTLEKPVNVLTAQQKRPAARASRSLKSVVPFVITSATAGLISVLSGSSNVWAAETGRTLVESAGQGILAGVVGPVVVLVLGVIFGVLGIEKLAGWHLRQSLKAERIKRAKETEEVIKESWPVNTHNSKLSLYRFLFMLKDRIIESVRFLLSQQRNYRMLTMRLRERILKPKKKQSLKKKQLLLLKIILLKQI